jgi:hypothetical protein
MKTYSKEGTPLAEALLTLEGLATVLSHPELQTAVDALALNDASQTALALAARFLPEPVLAKLPFDALHEAYEDLPVTATWQEYLAGHGNWGLAEGDAELAGRLSRAMAALKSN